MRNITFLLWALLLPSVSFAETFKVGLYEEPPLVFNKNSTLPGVYKEIFIEISKITSDTFEFDYGSAEQIISRFNQKKIDIEPGINPIWRHSEAVPGLYSIPFSKSASIMVNLKPVLSKSKKNTPKPSEKKKPLKTGLVRGYKYPNLTSYFKENTWVPVLASNELRLLTLLNQKKIDQAIIDQFVMNFFLHSKKNMASNQYVLSKPLETLDVMLRVHPDKASAIPRFNEAIKKLIDSGTIKKIYHHYGLVD
jgi:polar amino acid transport system substrate-binding protein